MRVPTSVLTNTVQIHEKPNYLEVFVQIYFSSSDIYRFRSCWHVYSSNAFVLQKVYSVACAAQCLKTFSHQAKAKKIKEQAKKDQSINDKHQGKFSFLLPLSSSVNRP